MKILNSIAGWRAASKSINRLLVVAALSFVCTTVAWGDPGRGRGGHDRGQDSREHSDRWRDLPPERKQELQQRYEQFRRLPVEEQARVREEYRRFRQLPEGERRVVKERWRQMTPEERSAYRRQLRERGRAEQH